MTTEFISLSDPLVDKDRAALLRAGELLRQGGLVVFPTETVYGLGADATRGEAAEKIYAAKGRPSDNPLIIHIASPEEAERYTETTPLYYRLAEAFMPGPLTVVLKAKASVPLAVRAGLPTVAVRCPAHPAARELIRAAGVPIAAPSANLSGSPSPTNARHVRDDMEGRVDMILDGGDSDIGLESTIVKIEEDGSLTLLRPGAITPDDLAAIGAKVTIADAVLGALKEGETVLSPGMKYKHYAPHTPFYLLDGAPEAAAAYLNGIRGRLAVLCYTGDADVFATLRNAHPIPVGEREDLFWLAKRLFSLLRDCDCGQYDAIYAPLPPPRGLGLALYNRMIRAAAHHIITL